MYFQQQHQQQGGYNGPYNNTANQQNPNLPQTPDSAPVYNQPNGHPNIQGNSASYYQNYQVYSQVPYQQKAHSNPDLGTYGALGSNRHVESTDGKEVGQV